MSERMTPERLADLRRDVNCFPMFDSWSRETVLALLAELDAVTRERDEARTTALNNAVNGAE